MIMIHIVEAGQGRYRAYADGELICTSKTPLLTAARKLLDKGYTPGSYIGLTRDGTNVDLYSMIGDAARRTVIENDKTGPRFGKWQENTRFG